jgi:hypothetical protein
MKRKFNPVLLCVFVGLSVALAGCQKDDTQVVKATPLPPPNAGAGQGGKQGPGGVIDMSVHPAPAGVKTGLEGGKKD